MGSKRKPKPRRRQSNVTKQKARLPRTFDPTTSIADALDTLLKERYHGAVNVRGIRFQVRYAALRALEMTRAAEAAAESQRKPGIDGGTTSRDVPSADPLQQPLLRMEGVEDVDVATPALGPLRLLGQAADAGGEYVQVKTAAAPWKWSQIKDPLRNWIELQRTGAPAVTFRLVVNFELVGELAVLARFCEGDQQQAAHVRRKFRQVAARLGATEAEADGVLDRLVVERIDDVTLKSRLRAILTETLKVVDAIALDAIELAITGRVLKWSEERAVVRPTDVLASVQAIGDGLAKQSRFQAIALGLIGIIDVSADATPDDFLSGRSTRFGHIVDGLDVTRPEWTSRIDAALTRAHVCIIRAPSGHGKSTLAFRYLHEHWPVSQVLVVRSAQTSEEVAALADYMRHRRQIGLPVRVLVDADYRTRFWPEVAAAAASIGAQILVTVRTEDYQRYPLNALTRREIIEPTLSDVEAASIYAELASRGRVADNVPSAAWTFEKLRRPRLLLEYVYLLTHGEMLEDRLREQVRTFRVLGEDPAKTDVLRVVSLGSALGAPVRLDALLAELTIRDDPQHVVLSLVGEYLTIDEGLVSGLHWVRSDHLARVLHDGGVPPIHQTAVRLLRLVPKNSLSFVIANALSWPGLDRPTFVNALVSNYKTADAATVVSIIEGLFEAGEREFFAANRAPFDEAHGLMGFDGMLLLWSESAPALRAGTVDSMIKLLGDQAGAFPQYKIWAEQVSDGPRGIDLVREFVNAILSFNNYDNLRPDGATGRLLDWCALAAVSISNWDETGDRLVAGADAYRLELDDALDLIQGLHRYDRLAFERWFEVHGETWSAYVQRQTRGLVLSLRRPSSVQVELARARTPNWQAGDAAMGLDPEARRQAETDANAAARDATRHGDPTADVELVFAVANDAGGKIADQTRSHLELLRRAFPFAGRYHTRGDYLLPAGFVLPVDNTTKAVPRWNLPLPSDVAKNRTWGDVVARAYLPDSFYRFQEAWNSARRAALRVLRGLEYALVQKLQRQSVNTVRAFGRNGEVLSEFETALRDVPWLSADQFIAFGQPLSDVLIAQLKHGAPNRWRTHLPTFIRQLSKYFGQSDQQAGRLSVVNFRDAGSALSGMHAFFEAMFLDSPDYFAARKLNSDEQRTYDNIGVLLTGLITEPVSRRLLHPVTELREREARRVARETAKIASAMQPLSAAGREVIPPQTIVRVGELTAAVIGVGVSRVEAPIDDLLPVLEALSGVAEVVDWFYLVPIRNGERLDSGAFSVSAHRLRPEADPATWDDRDVAAVVLALSFPISVPTEVVAHLPNLPLATKRLGPTLFQRAVGLQAAADLYARRRDQIENIGGGDPLPDHLALRSNLSHELLGMDGELCSNAQTLRAEVAADVLSADAALRAAAQTLIQVANDVDALVKGQLKSWPWSAERVEEAAHAITASSSSANGNLKNRSP